MKRILFCLFICLIFIGCSNPESRGIEVDINDLDDEVYSFSHKATVACVSMETTTPWWFPKKMKKKFNHPSGTLARKYDLPEHGFDIVTSDGQIGFPFSQYTYDQLKKEFK